MSSYQPSGGGGGGGGRARVPGPRGRGREGDVEEGAPYLKKPRPAKIGDALAVFPSPTRPSPGSQAHPTRPNNQPVRGWGGGGGQGGAPDSKEVHDAAREAEWPALPDPTGSSSSEPSPTQSQTSQPRGHSRNTGVANSRKQNESSFSNSGKQTESSSSSSARSSPRSQTQRSLVDSKQRHPSEGKQLEGRRDLSNKNTSSSSSSARSPLSETQKNVVDLSTKQRYQREGKQLEGRRDLSTKTTSSSSSARSTPLSQAQNNQPGCNASGADSKQGRLLQNTHSPSSSGGSTPQFTSPKEQITQLSYISVLEKGLDPHKLERLSQKLSLFLNGFTEDGGAFPYYKAELHAIKLRSPFRLSLEFKHMIQYNIELAFETWKCQGNIKDWILPSVQSFLKLHKYGSEDDIISKTYVALSGFPSSMKKVTDVLKNATYSLELLGGECRVCEAKADGKLVVQLFFTAAFARHAKDLSWDGNFSVNDMFIVNNAELHICRPCVVATGPSRLRDVQKGGQQLLPFFKGPAGYPAYFEQLEEDLGKTSISEVMEPWCVEYFCFHMASLPSMARRNFELALHYISKNIDIELEGIFGMLTCEMVTDWQQYIKNSGCKALQDVLNYIDPATGLQVKYENNIGGLVKYKRHFLEHALFGKIFDVNELELFGTKKFSKHLPGTVKLLLRRKRMLKCFGAAWSTLKSSRFDSRDTPAKQL